MLAQLIAGVGLPVLIDIIGRALGTVNHPAAKTASAALGNLQGALKIGTLSEEQLSEANRHAESLAAMEYKEYETALAQVNESLRAEVASEDVYVRRMRPTFGYLMAATWAAQMFGIAYVVVFETDKAALVLEGMAALSTIWAVGLSVLGIYIYKRSEDKKIASPGFDFPLIRAASKSRGLNE